MRSGFANGFGQGRTAAHGWLCRESPNGRGRVPHPSISSPHCRPSARTLIDRNEGGRSRSRTTLASLEPTFCLVPRTTPLAESSCSRGRARHAQPANRCDQVQQETHIARGKNLNLLRATKEQGRACSHRLVKLSTLHQSVQPIQVHHSRSSEFPACPHCCQHAVKRLRQRGSDRYLERGLSQRARSIAVCHQEASTRPGQSLCPAPSI